MGQNFKSLPALGKLQSNDVRLSVLPVQKKFVAYLLPQMPKDIQFIIAGEEDTAKVSVIINCRQSKVGRLLSDLDLHKIAKPVRRKRVQILNSPFR